MWKILQYLFHYRRVRPYRVSGWQYIWPYSADYKGVKIWVTSTVFAEDGASAVADFERINSEAVEVIPLRY